MPPRASKPPTPLPARTAPLQLHTHCPQYPHRHRLPPRRCHVGRIAARADACGTPVCNPLPLHRRFNSCCRRRRNCRSRAINCMIRRLGHPHSRTQSRQSLIRRSRARCLFCADPRPRRRCSCHMFVTCFSSETTKAFVSFFRIQIPPSKPTSCKGPTSAPRPTIPTPIHPPLHPVVP